MWIDAVTFASHVRLSQRCAATSKVTWNVYFMSPENRCLPLHTHMHRMDITCIVYSLLAAAAGDILYAIE